MYYLRCVIAVDSEPIFSPFVDPEVVGHVSQKRSSEEVDEVNISQFSGEIHYDCLDCLTHFIFKFFVLWVVVVRMSE